MTDVNSVNGAPRAYEPMTPVSSQNQSKPTDTVILSPEPGGASGDAIAQIAALLVKASSEERTNSRKLADLAEQRIKEETNRRIQEMHKAAEANFIAGVMTGVGQIASGATQIGSACMSMNSQATEGGASQQGPGAASAVSGCGASAAGVTGLWATAYGRKGKDHEAEAARHEAQAGAAEREWQKDHGDVQAARDAIRHVLECVDQVRQAQQAARSATVIRS
ncbi:MAG TPA: hypothetical protein VGJ84_12935 [Polyangiaceae bacterium]